MLNLAIQAVKLIIFNVLEEIQCQALNVMKLTTMREHNMSLRVTEIDNEASSHMLFCQPDDIDRLGV